MGDIDCQSTAFLAAKFSGKALELFRAGHHGADCAYVLPES